MTEFMRLGMFRAGLISLCALGIRSMEFYGSVAGLAFGNGLCGTLDIAIMSGVAVADRVGKHLPALI